MLYLADIQKLYAKPLELIDHQCDVILAFVRATGD